MVQDQGYALMFQTTNSRGAESFSTGTHYALLVAVTHDGVVDCENLCQHSLNGQQEGLQCQIAYNLY